MGTALVIGVGSENGVGGAVCRRFAREGLHVVVGGRTEKKVSAVAEALRVRGREAKAFAEIDQIVDWVVEGRQEGDVVLVMSNGAFGGIWEKLLTALGAVE